MRSSTKKNNRQPDAFVLPRYDEIALVLQGGGALGSYQAGVFEGLAEAGVQRAGAGERINRHRGNYRRVLS